MQLLTLRAQDINVLPAWLNPKTNFLSPESQNELLELFAHSIQRNIVKIINETAVQFAVVVDGTQDNTGTEQELIFAYDMLIHICALMKYFLACTVHLTHRVTLYLPLSKIYLSDWFASRAVDFQLFCLAVG